MLWLTACTNSQPPETKQARQPASLITNDTIPEIRKSVQSRPVASYLVPVNDPKLDRKFGVSVYETHETFRYLLRMRYEAIEETDTLTIPNFGISPVIKIQPGPNRQSCIIGFTDQHNTFRPCKMLSAKGNTMKLTVLKKYATGVYRKKMQQAEAK